MLTQTLGVCACMQYLAGLLHYIYLINVLFLSHSVMGVVDCHILGSPGKKINSLASFSSAPGTVKLQSGLKITPCFLSAQHCVLISSHQPWVYAQELGNKVNWCLWVLYLGTDLKKGEQTAVFPLFRWGNWAIIGKNLFGCKDWKEN